MNVLTTAICAVLFLSQAGFSQEQSTKHLGHIGIGIKLSSLGAGIETALPLFRYSNLRTSFNYFLYDRDLGDAGFGYRGELNFRSIQASYDWYPFRSGFRVSPTALVYNGTGVHAALVVPGGHTFSITKNTYESDPSDPINGAARMSFRKVAPGLTFGWGNLLSRHHRISFPVEFGFVFEGSPTVSLNMNGSGCDPKGRGCSSLSSNPSAVSSIHSEQAKIAREVTFLRFYPIISIGVGYRF